MKRISKISIFLPDIMIAPAAQDCRPFDLIGIVIGRVQAQYPTGVMLGGAK